MGPVHHVVCLLYTSLFQVFNVYSFPPQMQLTELTKRVPFHLLLVSLPSCAGKKRNLICLFVCYLHEHGHESWSCLWKETNFLEKATHLWGFFFFFQRKLPLFPTIQGGVIAQKKKKECRVHTRKPRSKQKWWRLIVINLMCSHGPCGEDHKPSDYAKKYA